MEALLILGALASGVHMYKHMEEEKAHMHETKNVSYIHEGISDIDWSKAGNFRIVSTDNDIKWVMLTED